MNCIKKFIQLIAIPTSLMLSIISGLPKVAIAESPREQSIKTWLISQSFTPPNRKGPPTTAGGGSRGDFCELKSNETLTPLLPVNKLGLTFAERPTFYWFIPETPTQEANFVLIDNQEVVYSTTFKLPNQSGIVGFTPPAEAPSLKVGKQYHWYLEIPCSAEDPEKEISVDGWVERIQPTLDISKRLASANSRQLSEIYAKAGIWHEAAYTLVQQRLANPQDPIVTNNWRLFLESVGLNDLVYKPLVNNSTTKTK